MLTPIFPGTFPVKALDPAAPSAPTPEKKTGTRPGGDSLQRDYAILVQNYRLTVGFDDTHFPLEAFSLHQGKVLLTYQDKNGARKQAFLTEELLQRLFRQRGIPYERGAAKRFMTALRTLLESWQLSPWEMALRKLTKEGKPEAAAWFRDLLARTESFDGHLIAQDPGGLTAAAPLAGDFSQAAVDRFRLTPAEYRGLIQTMKQELARREPAVLTPAPASLKTFDLVYTKADGALALRWDKKSGRLEGLDRPVSYGHTQKALPLPPSVSLADREGTFLSGFRALTGGSRTAADQLAALLASMTAPTARPPQLAVVYTKANVQPLRTFLTQVLGGKVLEGSLPKLLQTEGRKALLIAQTRGDLAVLAEPTLPTPSQVGDFVTLVQGARLPVKDKLVPSQAFRNQMALVYVTDSEKLAEALLQQYQARLVDLSAVEEPLPMTFALTAEETAWLQGCLLPYGALVNHRAPARRKTQEPEVPLVPDAQLQAFLARCCQVAPDLCCSRAELYDAWQAYHTDLHGVPSPETPTLFGKRVRKQALDGVEYKVKRYGPHKGTQLCYVGLGILDQPVQPLQTDAGREAAQFRAWLEGMEALYPG